jgi:small GTP-binding protein
VIHYKGAKIQLLDMPGIIEGAKDGKGRGRQVIAVARTCNIILIVLDALKPLAHKRIIEVGCFFEWMPTCGTCRKNSRGLEFG